MLSNPCGRIAPYSQGISFGNLVFVSGQLPLDPATGAVVPGGIAEQTARTFTNLRAVLEEAGSSLEKLLKTTVFLTDRDNWAAMNSPMMQVIRPPILKLIRRGQRLEKSLAGETTLAPMLILRRARRIAIKEMTTATGESKRLNTSIGSQIAPP